ncbi:hypothetical protein Bbelb_168760 [Branchiostoma belcheri]|nr:hypothetical protein Bbelb_168760 [Branchiostoma belcheri]
MFVRVNMQTVPLPATVELCQRDSGSEFLLHPYPCRITPHLLLCDPRNINIHELALFGMTPFLTWPPATPPPPGDEPVGEAVRGKPPAHASAPPTPAAACIAKFSSQDDAMFGQGVEKEFGAAAPAMGGVEKEFGAAAPAMGGVEKEFGAAAPAMGGVEKEFGAAAPAMGGVEKEFGAAAPAMVGVEKEFGAAAPAMGG